jgi:hypothetical protein
MWWALQRRTIYLGILLILILVFFGPSIYSSLKKTPTCFDEEQNGTELGVDCGGVCEKVCKFSAEEPVTLWSRSFEVRHGVYNSIAMIENPNIGTGALDVPYTFKLFDDRNVLVYERKGRVDIPAQVRFPIFEGSIVTGERIPQRTFFEFNTDIEWLKQESPVSDLRINEQKLVNQESSPRIEVEIENRGLQKIQNVEIFAIVYDMIDNATAGSKTFVETIEADSKRNLVFTWPAPFSVPAGRIEIIPRFNTR